MSWLNAICDWIFKPDNLTAISTFIIAIFTIVLVVVGYMQARLICKTIDLARQEFVASHRPRIKLRNVIYDSNQIIYWLVNIGDTRATISESWVFAELMEQGSRFRPILPTGHDDLGKLIIDGGETKELVCALSNGMSFWIRYPNSRRIGIDGPPIFWDGYFAGAIVYSDDSGIKRQSAFRRRWDDKSLTFVRLENEQDHEYSD